MYAPSEVPNYLAIDDIAFSDKCVQPNILPTGIPVPIVTTSSPCPNQFACTNPFKCIDKSKVCDFTLDCQDGSDEANCGTCNFDKNSMCGWTNIGAGKQQWSIYKYHFGSTLNLPNSATGSYLVIDTSQGNL